MHDDTCEREMHILKKRRTLFICLLALSLVLAGCGTGNQSAGISKGSTPAGESADAPPEDDEAPVAEIPIPPENIWNFDAPENHSMDPSILSALHTAVADINIHAIVTVKDGVIIDEYYKGGYDETSVFTLQSVSKTFTGTLIGLAIEQGYIAGVEAKLSEYLPQIADFEDAQKQAITLEHLLTHTSGLEWYEWGGNSSSWRPFRQSDNWVDYILSRNMIMRPGSAFAYSTGGTHLLAAVLQEATGQSAYEYGKEHLFSPMGMDSVEWRSDPQDITDGGNGIAMTARDAAKFGQLILNRGRWGDSQLLPESWIDQSVERRVPGADGASAYGYQWWLRTCGAGNYDVYYAMGHGGQFIFVVPELNLVTVMTSRTESTYTPRAYFIDYILAAYNGESEA